MNKRINDENCVHHWVLAQPNGPFSSGLCKLCGDTEEFPNSLAGSNWTKPSSAATSNKEK
ncbi:MAG: hypothetical protein ACJ0BE_02070 [Dehalococcoidia bacterium]